MHISFDYDKNKKSPQCNWPKYFKNFDGKEFDSKAPFESVYQIYAQRNYKYFTESGKRYPVPQVKPEGNLKLKRYSNLNKENNKELSLEVLHTREWAIWTESPKSSKQVIAAKIKFSNDPYGTLKSWDYNYETNAILPHRFYRFDSLPKVQRKGYIKRNTINLSDLNGSKTVEYKTDIRNTSLYTLIERIQTDNVKSIKSINLLDDLTMLRSNLSILPLKETKIQNESGNYKLNGFALAGLSALPLYFWKDQSSRVIAILGHNVAYILKSIRNI